MSRENEEHPKLPSLREIALYMRALAIKRWKRYAEPIARGEITAENYLYRPRGPMSPESKAKTRLHTVAEPDRERAASSLSA